MNSKTIYLTETGKTVYQYAIHITSLFDELEETVKKQNSETGLIKIGASITIGTHLIPSSNRRIHKAEKSGGITFIQCKLRLPVPYHLSQK